MWNNHFVQGAAVLESATIAIIDVSTVLESATIAIIVVCTVLESATIAIIGVSDFALNTNHGN